MDCELKFCGLTIILIWLPYFYFILRLKLHPHSPDQHYKLHPHSPDHHYRLHPHSPDQHYNMHLHSPDQHYKLHPHSPDQHYKLHPHSPDQHYKLLQTAIKFFLSLTLSPMHHIFRFPTALACFTLNLKAVWPFESQSQWQRGLNCRSAAARFSGLRVRIPLKAWMFVSCVSCV